MSDFAAYHALGHGSGVPDQYRQDTDGQNQPAPPQFRPPVAAAPAGYQQVGSPYNNMQGGTQAPQYGATPQPVSQDYQDPGYFPLQSGDQMGGMTAQMGGLGLQGDGSARGHKKKQRHAHHDLQQPMGSSQAYNGMPQGGTPNPSQYLDATQGHQPGPGSAYMEQRRPSTGFGAPSFGQQGMQQSAPTSETVSTQGKVDPEHIPSIPRLRDGTAQYYFDHVYATMEHHLPPPATIPFAAHDQGNSSPKFARLTLNNIPSTSESLASTGLPLGLVLQPLASQQEGEQPIPVLDFGEVGPPRCRRCRAYINPFMTFKSGGNKLVCNMCTFPNDVTSEYFAPTDPSGVRVDRMQRPELMMGTVEFLVPKEYWAKEPVGLRWLFLVDVTQEAVNRGFLASVCEGILNSLYGDGEEAEEDQTVEEILPGSRLPAGSRIGIVTYDKEIHFYNLKVRRIAWYQFCVTPKIDRYSGWPRPGSNDGYD